MFSWRNINVYCFIGALKVNENGKFKETTGVLLLVYHFDQHLSVCAFVVFVLRTTVKSLHTLQYLMKREISPEQIHEYLDTKCSLNLTKIGHFCLLWSGIMFRDCKKIILRFNNAEEMLTLNKAVD